MQSYTFVIIFTLLNFSQVFQLIKLFTLQKPQGAAEYKDISVISAVSLRTLLQTGHNARWLHLKVLH